MSGVHTGARAAASARMVGALAYTHGSSVVFGSGRYAPHSPAGRDLLAHGPAHALVARKISIRGESYTHGSKQGVTYLFNDVVAPELERRGYKTYGARSRLVEFVKANDIGFQDEGAFLDAFIPWLQGQTRRVRNGGVTPVLKQFSVMGMSRPAWPEELKELKGMVRQEQAADQQNKDKEKDNVRHVVRNATLKRALSIAFDRAGPGQEAIGAIRPEGDESLVVPAAAAGEMVVDIGLGFGFDFIEGRVPADQQDIGERQGRLVRSETALQAFIESNGERGYLLEILKLFMGRTDEQGAEPMDMT